MEKLNLRIKMVKFYQGVQVAGTSNQTSSRVVRTKTAQEPRLVSIEHAEKGVMIITELVDGNSEYTLVPYNNIAYVNHEIEPKEDSEQKLAKATNAMKPNKASSESK